MKHFLLLFKARFLASQIQELWLVWFQSFKWLSRYYDVALKEIQNHFPNSFHLSYVGMSYHIFLLLFITFKTCTKERQMLSEFGLLLHLLAFLLPVLWVIVPERKTIVPPRWFAILDFTERHHLHTGMLLTNVNSQRAVCFMRFLVDVNRRVRLWFR